MLIFRFITLALLYIFLMAKAFKHNKDGRVSEDAGFPADAKTSKAAAVVIFVFSFAVLLDLLDKVKALFF